MSNTKISYGNRENMENTVRAICDYIETHPRYIVCQMQDSADLNLTDARKCVASDNIGCARASADRAARYVFGMLSDEYKAVCLALDTL